MSSKKTKKYLILLLAFFLVPLCLAAGLVAVIDPFFHYHKPLTGVNYLIDNQISQNPGIAKNFEYDSVMLGSSMTNNFDTALFAEKMDLNTIKLCYNGAFPKDIDNIMTIVTDSPNEIKEVFLGIDIFTYKTEPGGTAYTVPGYLYDDNLLNDVYYLLNKEVILDYIIRPRDNTPINEIYWFWKDVIYGPEAVLKAYNPPAKQAEPFPADYYKENIATSMENYILPYIKSMPETTFTVFFPPYSILYWNSRDLDGSLRAEIQGEIQIIETLLQYPNVRIFFFQNDYEYITNLENYSDYTHFSKEMNDYMTNCFVTGENQLTSDNYETILKEMENWLLSQDLSQYTVTY